MFSFSQQTPTITADEKEIGPDYIIARGRVELVTEEIKIFADEISFFNKEQILKAAGRVAFIFNEIVFSGDRLYFNLNTKKGEMSNIIAFGRPTVRIEANRMEMISEEKLKLSRLSFSSCSQTVPRWEIESRSAAIKRNEYAELSSIVFKIKNIPVFYLPYMRYPIQKDGRSSGFLIPNIGQSSEKGFFLLNSFYLKLGRQMDLTFNFDYFRLMGIGSGGEWRYLFPGFSGSWQGYYFFYRDDYKGKNPEGNDFLVKGSHQQNLPFLNSRLVFNVDYTSSPNFLRVISGSFDRMLSANFRSEAFWSGKVKSWQFTARASRSETYYTEVDRSNIITYFPSVDVRMLSQKVGNLPGYFSLKLGYQRSKREGTSYEEFADFEEGFFIQKWQVSPSYSLNLIKLPFLSLNTQASFGLVSYDYSYLSEKKKQIVANPIWIQNYNFQAELKGLNFYQVYYGKRSKLKHLIEPSISFNYVNNDPDSARVVRVDYGDLPLFSYLKFSLSNRVLIRDSAELEKTRELFRFDLSQNYYLDEAEANYFRKIDGRYPKWSELNGNLILVPVQGFNLSIFSSYNYYIKDFRNLTVTMDISPETSVLSGRLSYSAYRNPYAPIDYYFNRKIFRSNLLIKNSGSPLSLEGGLDYDFTEKKIRFATLILSVDYQCMVFTFEYTNHIRFIGGETRLDGQFRFRFSLGNLGMVNDFFRSK